MNLNREVAADGRGSASALPPSALRQGALVTMLEGVTLETRGTIKPAENFDPEEMAVKLREAMKGWGSDDKALLDILSSHSAAQRLQSVSTHAA